MIKKNSWHYKLANFGDKRVYGGDVVDFCKYSRMVMLGAFLLLLLGGMGGWIVSSFVWTIVCLIMGYTIPAWAGAIVFSLLFMGAIGLLIAGHIKLREYRQEHAKEPKEQKEPGFFGMMYRKLKDKTCYIVEIED